MIKKVYWFNGSPLNWIYLRCCWWTVLRLSILLANGQYATTILIMCIGLQKNGQDHHLPRPLASTIGFRAYSRYSCRQSIPVLSGWCFPNGSLFFSMLCAVMHLVSLSSSVNREARLEDELTFDQLKFNSMKGTDQCHIYEWASPLLLFLFLLSQHLRSCLSGR